MFKGPEKVLINLEGRVRFCAFLTKLLKEALPLVDGIIQLGKAIGNFTTRHEELETIHHIRILRIPAGQGGDIGRVKGQSAG
jgi:hypothetical protein